MYNTQNSDLVYIVDVGAKNLLNVPNGSYTTVSSSNPTTFSVINGEMTVTTCTTNDTRQVEVASITLEAGDYVLTDRIFGSTAGDIRLMDNGSSITTGNPATFTLTETKTLIVRLYTYSTAALNATIKPMICTKAAWDISAEYVPCSLPNPILTPALIEQVDSGAKNLYNPDDLRGVPTGLTVTRESDGTTLKINGTYTGSDYAYIFVGHFTGTKTGTYYLASTNTKTMNANTYYVYTDDNHMMLDRTDDNDVTYYNYTTAPSKIKVVIRVSPNASFNNDTVKILICTLADWNVSHKFVPYRPNWDLVYSSLRCDAKYAKVPVSTSYSLIGSIKTKGNRVCRITVTQEYTAVAPTGLILSKSNQSSDFNTLTNRLAPPVETTTDDTTLTISALCYYTYDRVVYIWAKAKTASTNGNNFMALCEHFGDIDGVKNSMT